MRAAPYSGLRHRRLRDARSKTGRRRMRTPVPIFLTVPQVRRPERLDLARDAARAQRALPSAIVANWVEGRLP